VTGREYTPSERHEEERREVHVRRGEDVLEQKTIYN
jgi:hypothetical protein